MQRPDPEDVPELRDMIDEFFDLPSLLLRGRGAEVLAWASGTMLLLMALTTFSCIFAGLPMFAVGMGFFLGYMTRVTSSASTGALELPHFVDIESLWDGVIKPAFLVSPIVAFAIGFEILWAPGWWTALFVVWLPIFWLDLTLSESPFRVSLIWQIRAVARRPLAYASLVLMELVVVGLCALVLYYLGMLKSVFRPVAGLVAIPILVTAFTLLSHYVGRFFRHHDIIHPMLRRNPELASAFEREPLPRASEAPEEEVVLGGLEDVEQAPAEQVVAVAHE